VTTSLPHTDLAASQQPGPSVPSQGDVPIRSEDLLGNLACVRIEHAGMVYTLRATRAGKLILTK